MQRPRDVRIYQGRFWATARKTRSREISNGTTAIARQRILNNATVGRNNTRTVFSMWSVPRCYRDKVSSVQFCMGVKKGPKSVKLKNLYC
jgi:hypothetical protein